MKTLETDLITNIINIAVLIVLSINFLNSKTLEITLSMKINRHTISQGREYININ